MSLPSRGGYGKRRWKKAAAAPKKPKPPAPKPAAATDPHDEHRYAVWGERTLDAEALDPQLADEVRQASKRGEISCPVCKEGMIAKLGEVVRWHFAHRADAEFPGHEPESDYHKLAKRRLLEYAQAQWPSCQAREEWRLPQIRQIADVLAVIPGRRPLALEIQYADLSGPAWRARHAGYQSQNIDDLWVLGHTRMRVKGSVVHLDTLASSIIGARQEVMYLQPRSQQVTWIRVAPAVVFRAAAGERLGNTKALVVKAPLSHLRFDGGRAYLLPAEQSQD